MKKICIIIFGLLIVACFSCSKNNSKDPGWTFNCPAYSDTVFEHWFPYIVGQTLKFKNPTGIEKTITIGKVDKSAAISIIINDPPGVAIDYMCDPNEIIESTTPNSNDSFRIEHHLGGYAVNTLLRLYGAYVFASAAITDTGFILSSNPYQTSLTISKFFASYNLNGNNYSFVQVIARDTITNRTNDIYKIIIAKNEGIIGFEDYPTLDLWAKE